MLDLFAAGSPELPLYVVAEFEPHIGQWIPWHVKRSWAENRAAFRAALAGRQIHSAATVLARGTALSKMRALALATAPGRLTIYDEDLADAGWAGAALWLARPSPALARWARRLRNPRDAEIPVRARLAQAYGFAASRLRAHGRDIPLGGAGPLLRGITVVVPSRDGRDLLGTMLPWLAPQLSKGETIVVDNGSSDGTADWLSSAWPQVKIIRTQAPLSFARAVNAGILEARFNRVLLLNNDMIAEPGFIAALMAAFERVPDLFCATAQIFFPPGARREETGKAVWRRENELDFPVRCDEPLPGEDLTWVLYGSGGCSLFDTQKLRAIGGVAEVYDPAYVEDMDFGYRAWKRGWPSVFCAGARAEHRHRATTSRFYTARQLDFFVERNYLRFLIHAVGSAALFRRLWSEGIRRLQLLAMNGNDAAADALRDIPRVGPRPAPPVGPLSEPEILALGNGDVAVFPGCAPRGAKAVLIASPYLPFPLSHGGAVRIFNLMKQAAKTHDLTLVAFCDELAAPPPELLAICCEITLVRRRGSHYRLNTPRPDAVEEFESATFRACLKQTAAKWQPCVAQLEFTWMAQYADACGAAKTILVEHDVTFDLHQQLAAVSTDQGAVRLERERQLEKWRRFETAAWRRVDCVVTMSRKDSLMVTAAKSVATIPNGVDCERFQPSSREPEPRRLLFIGSFAHLPNLLALEFFLRDVWPRLGPGFALHVIAGNRPEYYLDFYRARVSIDLRGPGIEMEGFVADVRQAYERAAMVLAPLTASAGTNIKVLEAMAMGRAVVTTEAGINGLDLMPGSDVVLTRGAEEMAAAIHELAHDARKRKSIERRARETALRFDWRSIGASQRELYGKLAG